MERRGEGQGERLSWGGSVLASGLGFQMVEIVSTQKIRARVIGFKITFVSAGIGLIAANLDTLPSELLVICGGFA